MFSLISCLYHKISEFFAQTYDWLTSGRDVKNQKCEKFLHWHSTTFRFFLNVPKTMFNFQMCKHQPSQWITNMKYLSKSESNEKRLNTWCRCISLELDFQLFLESSSSWSDRWMVQKKNWNLKEFAFIVTTTYCDVWGDPHRFYLVSSKNTL